MILILFATVTIQTIPHCLQTLQSISVWANAWEIDIGRFPQNLSLSLHLYLSFLFLLSWCSFRVMKLSFNCFWLLFEQQLLLLLTEIIVRNEFASIRFFGWLTNSDDNFEAEILFIVLSNKVTILLWILKPEILKRMMLIRY